MVNNADKGGGLCDIDMDSCIKWGTICRTVGTRTCRNCHGKNDGWDCDHIYANPVTLDRYKQKHDKHRNRNQNCTQSIRD